MVRGMVAKNTLQEPLPQVELPGCKAYGKSDKCPVEWCRKARGNWCKTDGVWCRWRKI